MWRSILTKSFNRIRVTMNTRFSMSSSTQFTNELVRQRLMPYLDILPSYVDELSKTLPKLRQTRRASVLVPLYCDKTLNQVQVLLIKRSEKMRSHTGMVAFPGGMVDPTDRDIVHTAQREAQEEIGLQPHQYSLVGHVFPITDSRLVIITPVVALLNSPKFIDFQLSPDEATDAFYINLEQFLIDDDKHQSIEYGEDFLVHHFSIDGYYIWGVTAYELIIIATMVFQRSPQFPFFRHGKQLDVKNLTEQQKEHFQMCVDYGKLRRQKNIESHL